MLDMLARAHKEANDPDAGKKKKPAVGGLSAFRTDV
jgi:hypothetical protein